MKKNCIIVLTFLSINCFSQSQPYVDTKLSQIKSVPFYHLRTWQRADTNLTVYLYGRDSAYFKLLELGKSALPFLIEKLTDETVTEITDSCRNSKYKIGDLALLLVADITHVDPLHLLNQFFCHYVCGILPWGFMDRFDLHRQTVKDNAIKYFKLTMLKE